MIIEAHLFPRRKRTRRDSIWQLPEHRYLQRTVNEKRSTIQILCMRYWMSLAALALRHYDLSFFFVEEELATGQVETHVMRSRYFDLPPVLIGTKPAA